MLRYRQEVPDETTDEKAEAAGSAAGGGTVLYEFDFTFADGTSRCLLMYPSVPEFHQPNTNIGVDYWFYGEDKPRLHNTGKGSLQFFYDYYAAYNGPVDEEGLMEQYGG